MMKKNVISKILAMSTLSILLCVTVFGYKQYNEYEIMKIKYNNIIESVECNMENYISTILLENIRRAEDSLTIRTNDIQQTMLNRYAGELNDLEYDISNPSTDSELTKIFDEMLSDTYINKDSMSNKVFVASMDNILWNRSIGYQFDANQDIETQYMSWSKMKSVVHNTALTEQAINAIKNTNLENEFIFWEPIGSNNPHKCISSMNIKELLKIYKEEGITALSSYELLVPLYLTKEGDIFGTKDLNSLGYKIDNFKIIIIQRINILDALQPYLSYIYEYKHQIDDLRNDIIENQKRNAAAMAQSTIIGIFVIIGSGCLQNKIPKQD